MLEYGAAVLADEQSEAGRVWFGDMREDGVDSIGRRFAIGWSRMRSQSRGRDRQAEDNDNTVSRSSRAALGSSACFVRRRPTIMAAAWRTHARVPPRSILARLGPRDVKETDKHPHQTIGPWVRGAVC